MCQEIDHGENALIHVPCPASNRRAKPPTEPAVSVDHPAIDVIFRTASVMAETVDFFDKVELESVPLGVTPPVLVDAS